MKKQLFNLLLLVSLVGSLFSCRSEDWDMFTEDAFVIEDNAYKISDGIVTKENNQYKIVLVSNGLTVNASSGTIEGDGAQLTLVLQNTNGLENGNYDFGSTSDDKVWIQGYHQASSSETPIGLSYGQLVFSQSNGYYSIELLSTNSQDQRVAIKYSGSLTETNL